MTFEDRVLHELKGIRGALRLIIKEQWKNEEGCEIVDLENMHAYQIESAYGKDATEESAKKIIKEKYRKKYKPIMDGLQGIEWQKDQPESE